MHENLLYRHRLGEKLELILNVCECFPIKRLFLFGSILRDDFNENSDVDVQVEFENFSIEEYFDIYYDLKTNLETILHRKIDLVDIDEVKNIRLKKYLLEQQIEIYAS